MLVNRLTSFFAALLAATALALAAPAMAAEPGYKAVQTDVSSPEGKVLVQEFFWYGCPHCYYLESELEPWIEELDEDVVFERRALALGQHWVPLTRAFYAADQLGVVDDTHAQVFHAIHEEGTRLTDADSIADFYAKQGVDREAFLEAFNGFGTQNAIRQTGQIAQDAAVQGVPALLVDGRYLVTGRLAGGNVEMLRVVDTLIEQIRDERN
ncbi:thiol:disulfide interchange protein DsbA/DsbL [Guyparkeria halophila]|uniref:Thiol:disulfide interchange protein n=1 Tax=Guyparkeria halophila TaxID=47960 RepID=A0ABZ0YWY6_9GAMM|nr:thiol:disulfide interchange protein DsbA/DsbL [Guyparkeria halophila]WQH16538.1 thiol:disulfide interchange protein DsbA/DsbL [Guyparkeria halophila]